MAKFNQKVAQKLMKIQGELDELLAIEGTIKEQRELPITFTETIQNFQGYLEDFEVQLRERVL